MIHQCQWNFESTKIVGSQTPIFGRLYTVPILENHTWFMIINIYIWLCWLWLCWFVVRKLGVDQYWLDLIGGSRWQFDLAKRYPSTNNEMFLCHNGPSLKIGHLHQGTSSVVYGLFEIGYPQSWWLINSFPSFPPKNAIDIAGPLPVPHGSLLEAPNSRELPCELSWAPRFSRGVFFAGVWSWNRSKASVLQI